MASTATSRHRRPLNMVEAAQYLGVSRQTLRRAVWAQEIPTIRLGKGRMIRIDPYDLDSYLQSKRTPGDPAIYSEPRTGVR